MILALFTDQDGFFPLSHADALENPLLIAGNGTTGQEVETQIFLANTRGRLVSDMDTQTDLLALDREPLFEPGEILVVGQEKMLVNGVDAANQRCTVVRGYKNTTPSTQSQGTLALAAYRAATLTLSPEDRDQPSQTGWIRLAARQEDLPLAIPGGTLSLPDKDHQAIVPIWVRVSIPEGAPMGRHALSLMLSRTLAEIGDPE